MLMSLKRDGSPRLSGPILRRGTGGGGITLDDTSSFSARSGWRTVEWTRCDPDLPMRYGIGSYQGSVGVGRWGDASGRSGAKHEN